MARTDLDARGATRRTFLKTLLAGGAAAAAGSAGLGLLGCRARAGAPGTDGRPNIVMLFADDVGWGDLGCFGHPTVQTPHLDRMADEGMRLTSFYSAPWCVPARIQLMTGRYPPRTGIGGTSVGGSGGIPDREVTLAEALKAAGYRTGMMGKWHLGYAKDAYLPTGQGFDYYFGLPYSNDMRKPWVNTDVPLWLYENTKKVEHPVNQDTLTTRYTEHAVDFIRKNRDGPFFLYLAYAMAHLPIHTTEQFRGTSRAGLYGDVMATIDWSAGQILSTLKELGLDENTIVCFTSDNGPWLNLPKRMLQGGNQPWHQGTPGALRGWKHTTYEGGLREPTIVRWPGRIPPNRDSSDMACLLDLYVTFVKLGGGDLPDHPVDGLDLMPWLEGKADRSPRKEFFYVLHNRVEAVRDEEWKLRTRDGVELFNLQSDPSERYNRAEEKPEIVERLHKRMEAKAEEIGARVAGQKKKK
ncbi:MAG: sulfatase [Phycisphaerae bacterium]